MLNESTARRYYRQTISIVILAGALLTLPTLSSSARTRTMARQPAGIAECSPRCMRGPRYFLARVDRLPSGMVIIAGVNSNNPVSTQNEVLLRLVLKSTDSSARQRLNRYYVAAQLNLLASAGSDSATLASALECFGLDFDPVRLSSGYILSPASTLDELLDQARRAAHDDTAADQTVLANLMHLLTGDDVAGRCAPGGELAFSAAKRQAFEEAVTRILATHNVPGLVAYVSVPGEGRWVTARGLADRASGRPITTDLHFRIGSVTKTFVTTVALRLAEKPGSTFHLDDPVSKYVDFVKNGDRITIRQLGNMTSGLNSYTRYRPFVIEVYTNTTRVWTAREVVDIGLGLDVSFNPGEGWDYSNTNTVLLGIILEAYSGKTLPTLLAEEVFRPLGLRDTSWPTGTAIPEPFARGITEDVNDIVVDATNWNPSWGQGAGQLVSNLEDLKIYARALGTGSILSPASQAERLRFIEIPPLTRTHRYGFGIGDANGWLGHTGSLPGYNTCVYYFAAKDAIIVVLANSDIELNHAGPAAALFDALGAIAIPSNPPRKGVDLEDDLPEP